MISSIAMMLLGAAFSTTTMTPSFLAVVKNHQFTRYSVALTLLSKYVPADDLPEANRRSITPVTAHVTLTATVDRSEWTPSKTLTLDLENGRYAVVPPSSGWSTNIEKPRTRTGQLTGDALTQIQGLAASAFSNGLAVPACEIRHGVGWNHYGGNTGPGSLSLTKTGVTKSSGLRSCWSDSLVQLDAAITRLFDFRSP